MTAGDLHSRVAAIALDAASKHGFALGGGNALIAHGVISRPTQDVDLFTNQEHGVAAATPAVEQALTAAGYTLHREDQAGGLADIFPDMGAGLAEWTVISPAGEQTVLQPAYFDRTREPVTTTTGPLLALEDVIAGKVCALASQVEPRDYADTARLLDRYTPGPADRVGPSARSRADRPRLRWCCDPARQHRRHQLRSLRPVPAADNSPPRALHRVAPYRARGSSGPGCHRASQAPAGPSSS